MTTIQAKFSKLKITYRNGQVSLIGDESFQMGSLAGTIKECIVMEPANIENISFKEDFSKEFENCTLVVAMH